MAKRDEFKKKHDESPEVAADRDYIRKLEAENRALKKQVGTDQGLFEYVKDAICSFKPPEKVKYEKPKLSHADLHAVLIIADAHAEESVSLEEMEGLASYDWDTFVNRLSRTASKTLELVNIMRQASNIVDLSVWSLGDWFCGRIQPQEEAYGVTMPMPVAVPKVGRAFGKFLVALSSHFDRVNVSGMCGNHGREGKKVVFKMTADRNWDMSVYLIAQGYTEQCKNISWNIPHSIMDVVSVMGYNCLLSHSAEVQMHHRVPYYPIETTMDQEHKTRSGTDKDFRYAFMGHWHHHAILDSSIVICPSMMGPNQYSRFRLHRRSEPEQLLCFFTEKHGLVTQWPIKL